jgi:outer membrane protein OmpA-like peptidoglycan-associated protein
LTSATEKGAAVINRMAVLFAVPLIFSATQAMAQGANQSVDEIIKSLTPKGDVTKYTTRGLPRPSAPAVTLANPTEPVKADSSVVPVKADSPAEPVKADSPVVPVKADSPAEPVKADSPAEPVTVASPTVSASSSRPTEPASPTPVAAVPPVAVAMVAPRLPPGGLAALNFTVNFASGSVDLTPQAMQVLDKMGAALGSTELAKYRFRIEGHTDTVGSPEFNRALSQRRAETVVNYISQKFGLDRTRLDPVGMGAGDPLVPTGPQVPEPRNRRVNVVNMGA